MLTSEPEFGCWELEVHAIIVHEVVKAEYKIMTE